MAKKTLKLNVCPKCATLAIIIERGTYIRMSVQCSRKTSLLRSVKSWGVQCGKCEISTKGNHKTEASAIRAFNRISYLVREVSHA